ncbi:HNH endonuclease signature motif containing protein [Niabella insulamsoli]|uniref:HNH endonuclease signature motif containing protein n=1 Tax=Niabella insulamsoli TaxID=3144874 RepID=UPI0031FDDCD9
MAVSKLTEANKAYIVANRLSKSATQMALELGLGKWVVVKFLRKEGLSLSREQIRKFAALSMTGKTTFSLTEDAFIGDHYLILPIKKIAAKLNRSYTGIMGRIAALGLEIPDHIVDMNTAAGRLKTGNIPQNKGKRWRDYLTKEAQQRASRGWFKKGQTNYNDCGKDGTIRVRHSVPSTGGKPEKFIRIAKGKWKPLRHHVWEHHHGPIPKKMIVAVKDGDSLNVEDINNLELITMAENMKRNTIHNWPEEVKDTIKLNNKLKKALHEKQAKRSK